jgi:hypothetical protein
LTLDGSEHQRGNNVAGRRAKNKKKKKRKEKKQASLCSDNVAGGGDGIAGRENLEGHIALG